MVDTARKEPLPVRSGAVEIEAHSLVLLRYGADRRIETRESARREPLSPVEKHTL
jgi:hypothetical protein